MSRYFTPLLLIGLVANVSRADIVTYDFAVPSGIGIQYGYFDTGATWGMPMAGRISLDREWQGAELQGDGTVTFSTLGSMSITIGGQTFRSDSAQPLHGVFHPFVPLVPSYLGGMSEFLEFYADVDIPEKYGGIATGSYLNLTVYPLPGRSLASVVPWDLLDYSGGTGQVSFRVGRATPGEEWDYPAVYFDGFIQGITPVTATPEPATFVLAAISWLIGLGWPGKRSRRA